MIKELYSRVYPCYLSLPVLGSILDDFDNWLVEQGYRRSSRLSYISDARRIDAHLHHKQGLQCLEELTLDNLHTCWRWFYSRKVRVTHTVVNVRKFLQWQEILPADPERPSRFSSYLNPYRTHLTEVRGLAEKTIGEHLTTASRFLEHLVPGQMPLKLDELTASDVEAFVSHVGGRLKRESLQHVIAHLRSFLRWLALAGDTPPGLDTQIDTPRVYRLEQLPRALPWETVCAFLDSIDRETPIGLRDYTIFYLMATYGLRCCDIVALTLDDLHWRRGEIRIGQRKTGYTLPLPLTDAVGTVLLHYLRNGRPRCPYRQLFLRTRAPIEPLRRNAVTRSFHAWVERSGLEIPPQGAHCLRHSYAVHLLRQGTSVKTIGDLLGHRTAESTCVYLRLALEDLREVALPVPQAGSEQHDQGGHS